MTQKAMLTTVLLLSVFYCYGQDERETWEKNYQEKNYVEIIDFEKGYADSVDKNQDILQSYLRLDKYKIKATYLGKSRPIDYEVMFSMKKVFKFYVGNPEQLDELVKNEFLFDIEGNEIWMPIQTQLEKAFKKEIKKADEPALYCLFFNEHSQKGQLYNTFLISEFRKW
jgi:hypothetical protein